VVGIASQVGIPGEVMLHWVKLDNVGIFAINYSSFIDVWSDIGHLK
jgi:hypothetical protein